MIKKQKHKNYETKTQDVQNKSEKQIFIMLTYANMNMKTT